MDNSWYGQQYMYGQLRSTWDFIGISDACLKIFKILHYGFTMLSRDLTLSHTCISYVCAKFPWNDSLGQCIFLSIRYFKGFRDLLKKVVTFDGVKKIIRDQRSKNYRSSHQSCSMKKDVLRNFTKFTGKHLCQSLFFNKVVGLRPVTLLKKRLWHRCFLVNFVKFLRHRFYRTPLGDCFCL